MRKLLVIGSDHDRHITEVIADVKTEITILNRFSLPNFTIDYQKENFVVNDEVFSFNEPLVIWWRQKSSFMRFPPVNSATKEDLDRKNCYNGTWDRINNALPFILSDCIHTNPASSRMRSYNKATQLFMAKRCGLNIPVTAISNSLASIEEILNADVLMKRYADIHMQNGIGSSVKQLSVASLSEFAENIQLFPIIFQNYIEKQYEVRANIIGNEIFAAKIDSQTHEGGKKDWRLIQGQTKIFSPLQLDAEIVSKLVAYREDAKLDFGVFDLIKKKDGSWIFLECNPDGQWLFLDPASAQLTTQAMSRHLVSLCEKP